MTYFNEETGVALHVENIMVIWLIIFYFPKLVRVVYNTTPETWLSESFQMSINGCIYGCNYYMEGSIHLCMYTPLEEQWEAFLSSYSLYVVVQGMLRLKAATISSCTCTKE